MDYIRTVVSGKKHRFIDERYNLDLTYITPRIIAMAFPGSGLKKLYRNTIEDVSKFLKERHQNNYIIFNLSGVKYDSTKFDGKVLDYDNWMDHHSPPIDLLFTLVEKIHKFLLSDDKNVIVVNCNAGKGRTGTLICCYLLFSGKFKETKDAFDYYSLKRFNKGFGVTHASQKRYVNYFFDIISKRTIPTPRVRHIDKIDITCYPFNTDTKLIPIIDINDNTKDIFKHTCESPIKLSNENSNNELNIINNTNIPITGDVLMHLYNKGVIKHKKMGRLSFNTWFIDEDKNEYLFTLHEIDPYKFPIKNKVKEDYGIKLHFTDLCKDCGNCEFNCYCDQCKIALKKEIEKYNLICQFLDNYSVNKNDSVQLLFGNDPSLDDVDLVLSKRNLLLTPKLDRRDQSEIEKDANCNIY